MSTTAVDASAARRNDLDALRAFAMLLGIGLHVSLSFFPMPWPVQDSRQSGLFALLNALIHGFRMPLFFLLSGFFTMMLYRRRGLRALVAQRAVRILVPCLAGLITVVPLLHYVDGYAISSALPRGDQSQKPLIASIQAGDAAAVRAALAAGADVAEPDAAFKVPPLTWASLVGDAEIVKLLLDRGAELNRAGEDGSTALHSAAFLGRDSVVQLLLERGADPAAVSRAGVTPLAAADAPEQITVGIAKFLGLSAPPSAELEQGRSRARDMLRAQAAASGQPPATANSSVAGPDAVVAAYAEAMNSDAFRVNLGGLPLHLVNSPIFDHLWFLWFLCWLVAIFAAGAWLRSLLLGGSKTPAPASMHAAWALIPVTIVPQWFMGTAFPQFGPDTSAGLLPQPHVLAYYAVFFAFGAIYFSAHDTAGGLGRRWRLLLPLGLLILFPAGIATLGLRPYSALIQPAYAWVMSIGLIGLFQARLSRPSPAIRYLSDASYWMYLVHLPLVIMGQAIVRDWGWPAPLKFLLLNAATIVLLLLAYQLCVRYTWIGLVLNGRRTRPKAVSLQYATASAAGE